MSTCVKASYLISLLAFLAVIETSLIIATSPATILIVNIFMMLTTATFASCLVNHCQRVDYYGYFDTYSRLEDDNVIVP